MSERRPPWGHHEGIDIRVGVRDSTRWVALPFLTLMVGHLADEHDAVTGDLDQQPVTTPTGLLQVVVHLHAFESFRQNLDAIDV